MVATGVEAVRPAMPAALAPESSPVATLSLFWTMDEASAVEDARMRTCTATASRRRRASTTSRIVTRERLMPSEAAIEIAKPRLTDSVTSAAVRLPPSVTDTSTDGPSTMVKYCEVSRPELLVAWQASAHTLAEAVKTTNDTARGQDRPEIATDTKFKYSPLEFGVSTAERVGAGQRRQCDASVCAEPAGHGLQSDRPEPAYPAMHEQVDEPALAIEFAGHEKHVAEVVAPVVAESTRRLVRACSTYGTRAGPGTRVSRDADAVTQHVARLSGDVVRWARHTRRPCRHVQVGSSLARTARGGPRDGFEPARGTC
eukprot:2932038-Rhodomonas_salina.2